MRLPPQKIVHLLQLIGSRFKKINQIYLNEVIFSKVGRLLQGAASLGVEEGFRL